jgi:hypothetical protein
MSESTVSLSHCGSLAVCSCVELCVQGAQYKDLACDVM